MILDIIILALLAFSIWNGYRRGFFQIVASVILFLVALWLGSAVGTILGNALFGSSYLNPIIGFFIGFIAILIVGLFLIKKIKPKRGIISGFDRILGALLSGIRMLLLIGVLAAFFKLFHLPSAKTINESKLYSVSLDAAATIVTQLKPLAAKSSDILNEIK